MPITIRQATLADLDDVAAIEAQCFPQAEAATRASLADRLSAYPQSFLIAESAGQPVGFINGCVTDAPTIDDDMFSDTACHDPQGRYQAIFGLDVLPDYRRQGIAASLMQALIDVARAQGRAGLILTCKEHLLPYYEKFGFQNQGVSASVHGGAVWYDMLLTL